MLQYRRSAGGHWAVHRKGHFFFYPKPLCNVKDKDFSDTHSKVENENLRSLCLEDSSIEKSASVCDLGDLSSLSHSLVSSVEWGFHAHLVGLFYIWVGTVPYSGLFLHVLLCELAFILFICHNNYTVTCSPRPRCHIIICWCTNPHYRDSAYLLDLYFNDCGKV